MSAIVAAHGGTVSAQAHLGAGTTFVVFLPITAMTPPSGSASGAALGSESARATTAAEGTDRPGDAALAQIAGPHRPPGEVDNEP